MIDRFPPPLPCIRRLYCPSLLRSRVDRRLPPSLGGSRQHHHHAEKVAWEMSLITGDPEDSPRDCSRASSRPHHHHHHGKRRRRTLIAVSSAAASVVSLAIILWLTLRPSSPSFSLLAATATAANANASAAGAATIITVDAAVTAHNPNAHDTALYDQLQATASYAGAPLGGAAPLLPTPLEQPQGDVVLSAMLTSSSAAAGTTWRSLRPDERALLRVRIQGQLRWKVAAWVSATHGLTVDCIAAVLLQGPAVPPGQLQQQQQGNSVSFPSQSQCATYVQ